MAQRGDTLTIYTSPGIKDRLRMVAMLKRTTMTDFINEAIERSLQEFEAADKETRDFIARHTGEGK